MLELNKWFFVQLVNFLVLIVLLNYILFRPLLRLFKERERHTKGFLDDASAMDKEKDNLLYQIETKLSEARNKAKRTFEEISKEGLEVQKQTLDSAKENAAKMAKKAHKDLKDAAKKARESLKSDVEAFSKEIVGKMVGV